jgi:amino acid permease
LKADFHGNKLIDIGNFSLLFSVITAAPLCVLPSKDSIEELFFKEKGMNNKQNFMVTLLLLSVNMAPALFIDGVGDAMTLVGSTINPVIGFFMPVYFHWQLIKDKSMFHKDKIFGIITIIIIGGVSVLSLV